MKRKCRNFLLLLPLKKYIPLPLLSPVSLLSLQCLLASVGVSTLPFSYPRWSTDYVHCYFLFLAWRGVLVYNQCCERRSWRKTSCLSVRHSLLQVLPKVSLPGYQCFVWLVWGWWYQCKFVERFLVYYIISFKFLHSLSKVTKVSEIKLLTSYFIHVVSFLARLHFHFRFIFRYWTEALLFVF